MKKNKKTKKVQTNPFNPDYFSYTDDYPIEEVWNTDNVLAQLIVPRLLAFKELDKHGCPGDFKDMRAQNNAIQKMVDAFEFDCKRIEIASWLFEHGKELQNNYAEN